MISSLPTFMPRPMPVYGLSASNPASMRSLRPKRSPEHYQAEKRELASRASEMIVALSKVPGLKVKEFMRRFTITLRMFRSAGKR